MEFVEVPVGNDAFTAQRLSDVFTSEGVPNELLLGSDPKAGLSRSSRHRIVVAAEALPLVEAIVRDHAPHLVGGELIEHYRPSRPGRAASARLLFGVPLLALALATILAVLFLVAIAVV